MSTIKNSIEEKQKKLELLRKKKEEREKKKRDEDFKQPVSTPLKEPPSAQSKQSRASTGQETRILDIVGRFGAAEAKPEPTPVPLATVSSPIKPKAVLKVDTRIEFNTYPRPKPAQIEEEVQVELEKYSKQDDSKADESKDTSKTIRRTSHVAPPKPETHTKDEEEPIEEAQNELDNEAVEAILNSKEFADFFNKSVSLVEEALNEEFDIYETFIKDSKVEESVEHHRKLKHQLRLTSGHYQNRCIGMIQFCPYSDDLVLAPYVKKGDPNSYEVHGTVAVWSLTNKVERLLTCHSSVTSACFVKNEPNLILGGTYSGQLILWDLRSKSAAAQRSAMLNEAHSYPISGISLLNSSGGNSIVSVSSDGKVCMWSVGILHSPIYSLELKHRGKEIAISSLAFSQQSPIDLYIGNEDGSIMNWNINPTSFVDTPGPIYEGHFAPVTSLDVHPMMESSIGEKISDLFLSCSVDWTLKLWNKNKDSPLVSLESFSDYVYDAKWSPANPSMFGVVDGDGYMDLWDLSKGIEGGQIKYECSNHALNCLEWDNDGFRVATGSSVGELDFFSIDKDWGMARGEDLRRFEKIMKE